MDLEPLKTLNYGIGGDRVQNVLWRAQNFPVISSLKNVVILCGTNNLFTDSPKDIADDIIEIAQTFQSKYSSINIDIGGVLPRDASWSINRELKEVNEILKAKCCKSFFIYISNHFLYKSAAIIVGLLQMIRLTQIPSFWIMCI